MAQPLREKLSDALNLIVVLAIDAVTVLLIGLISWGLKFCLEKIYDTDIDHVNNEALRTVYYSSEILLVALFVVFLCTHLGIEIKKAFKKIRDE